MDKYDAMTVEQLTDQWIKARQAAKEWTAFENALRAKVVERMFKDPKKGTNKYTLSDGRIVKLIHNITTKLDGGQQHVDIIRDLIADGVLPKILLKAKYELAETVYKTLSDEQKLAIADYVVTKPESPQVTLE